MENSLTGLLEHSPTYQIVNPQKECPFFGTNFNITSALSGHQPRTLPQIIDSREG